MSPGDRACEELLGLVGPVPAGLAVWGSIRLGRLGLPDLPRTARRFPVQPSGRRRQRVALALTLACHPRPVLS